MAGDTDGMLTALDEPKDTTPPEVEPAPTGEGDAPEEPTPPKKAADSPETLAQRRADELTRARREAERRAEKAEAELAALKRKTEAGARPQPPDPSAYTDADGRLVADRWRQAQTEHEDKLHAWREAQKAPAPPAEPEPDAPDPDMARSIATFREGVAALADQHPDILEVIERPVFSPAMREAVWGSEVGPQLAYYLGTHQAEALKIANLPAPQAYRELGKLEAKLAAAAPAAPAPRTVSGAPEPITPVRGATPSAKDPERMSTEEFMAWDRARMAERLKANPIGL